MLLGLLIVIGSIYVLAKISSPKVWRGWTPRTKGKDTREKPYGLPWMGGTLKKKR